MTAALIQRCARQMMPWLLALYAGVSLLHFTHNAEFLRQYPNLPAWWTRADVYLAWCSATAVGLLGYVLYRGGLPRVGLTLLTIYGSLGFDGLLHYTRAPIGRHSAAMNFTIWFEVAAATVFLVSVAATGAWQLRLNAEAPPNNRWGGP